MGFLDVLKSWIKPEDKSYEDIMNERSKLKKEIAQTLKESNFTEMESKEVLLIIDETEKKIESIKREIARLSRSFDNPTERVRSLREEITTETKNMNENIKLKVKEIMERKIARNQA